MKRELKKAGMSSKSKPVTPGWFCGWRDWETKDGTWASQIVYFFGGRRPMVRMLVRGDSLSNVRKLKHRVAEILNENKDSLISILS